jgi:hypothetical protein
VRRWGVAVGYVMGRIRGWNAASEHLHKAYAVEHAERAAFWTRKADTDKKRIAELESKLAKAREALS